MSTWARHLKVRRCLNLTDFSWRQVLKYLFSILLWVSFHQLQCTLVTGCRWGPCAWGRKWPQGILPTSRDLLASLWACASARNLFYTSPWPGIDHELHAFDCLIMPQHVLPPSRKTWEPPYAPTTFWPICKTLHLLPLFPTSYHPGDCKQASVLWIVVYM